MLSFNSLDAKTGLPLPIPPKQSDHTYLEYLLRDRLNDPTLKLAVAKLYEGVIEADLEDLQAQGLYLMVSSGQTAYFGDAETAALVVGETGLFQNHSDAVAYSLPVSEAGASLVLSQGRVLVIDDEVDIEGDPAAQWGNKPIRLANGETASTDLLQVAASRLGDGYTLLSPDSQRALVEQSALAKLERLGAIALTNTGITVEGEPTPESLAAPFRDLLKGAVSDVGLELEVTPPKRDGSVVVKWSAAGETPQRGKALLTPTGDGTYQATVVGGIEALQPTVNQSFNTFQQGLNTPFQFRAGMTVWQGAMKGTCRASELCEALGVQAIIPLSAIKGDAVKDGGKTVQAGIHSIDGDLFWSYKTPAKTIQQRLGAQALVNLPEGTRSDVLPKVEAKLADLAVAQSDPRLVADLYIKSYERRQDQLEADPEFESSEQRVDWLYEALKADVRPTTVVNSIESIELATILRPESWQQLQTIASQGLSVETFVEQANEVLSAEEAATNAGIYHYYWFTEDTILNPVATDVTYPTTFSTLQRGGYSQLIEHEKVVDQLERFMQSEWEDIATGGVYVPCAVAQPHRALAPNEVCFKDLPHGAQVALYRSPVANVAAFDVFTNNLEVVRQADREAFQQQGISYMNPDTAKRLVVDFDGDRVAIIPAEDIQPTQTQTLAGLGATEVFIPNLPHGQTVTLYHSGNQVSTFINNTSLRDTVEGTLNDRPERLSQVFVPTALKLNPERQVHVGYYDGLHGYQRLHEEIKELNAPDRKPVQVEKEKKIPRNAANGFPTLASAALHAADNPTGAVANNGMKLEALRWDLQYTPDADKEGCLARVSRHAVSLLKDASDPEKDFSIPAPTAKGYGFKAALQSIARSQTLVNASDPAVRLEQVKTQLALVDRFLFQVEGLNAVQLQRAVDTPKSALLVNKAEFGFCREVAGYLEVGWVKEKNELDLYRGGKTLSVQTHDPVSWLVNATNARYQNSELESQVNRCYRQLCPTDTFTPEQGKVALAVATAYNSAIFQSVEMEAVAKTETGPALYLKSQSGREIRVTNLTLFDPSGKGSIWSAAKAGVPFDLKIVPNGKVSKKQSLEIGINKGWKTCETHEYRVEATIEGKPHTIGTLSPQSAKALQVWQGTRGNLDGMTMKGAVPQLGISVDKEDAKQLRVGADANIRAWAESVPVADQAAYCDALWHHQGQKLAIKLFPDAMAERLAEFRLTETRAIGLQYDSNAWGAALPTGAVAVRMAVETDANPNQHKPVLQIANATGEWRSLGPVSSDFYAPPIGTTATATIRPGNIAAFNLTTKQGAVVSMKPLKGKALVPTPPGETLTVQFKYTLDKKGLVMTGDPPQKLGELTPESVALIQGIEQQGKPIFNSGIQRNVDLSVSRYQDAELSLADLVMPTEWCRAADWEHWTALESGHPTQPPIEFAPRLPVESAVTPHAVPVVTTPLVVEAPVAVEAVVAVPAVIPTHSTPTPQSQPPAAATTQPLQPPAPETAATLLEPDIQALETAYAGYRERVKLVYTIMGSPHPTVQEIDTGIVACIQQTVPQVEQGDALRCLQRSPKVLELKEQGYAAAAAYVNQVLSPAPVAQSKVKPPSRGKGLEL